jgi:predicted ATPase with chaperone activity
MPKTVLVGLAETAVRESTHRVERALVNSGYHRPIDRVVINLAPDRFVSIPSSRGDHLSKSLACLIRLPGPFIHHSAHLG